MNIGILGAGQLGRMLALAAAPLNINVCYVGENGGAMIMGQQLSNNLLDQATLSKLAQMCQAVTFETEHIPIAAQQALAQVTCRPNLNALFTLQQRLRQKNYMAQLSLPVTEFMAVSDPSHLATAGKKLGYPFMLKRASDGYDGRGQFVVQNTADHATAWQQLGPAVPLVAERFINFTAEFSQLAVRSQDGQIAYYAATQNRHYRGILIESYAPADLTDAQLAIAHQACERLLTALDYVGVLAIEFFVASDAVWINEVAPRVHNSGHWTQDGAVTSQFENHLRAIAGLPLGETRQIQPAAMHNLIGGLPPQRQVLAIPGAKLHLYNKTARAGRKLGHVNLVAPTPEQLVERQAQLRQVIAGAQRFD